MHEDAARQPPTHESFESFILTAPMPYAWHDQARLHFVEGKQCGHYWVNNDTPLEATRREPHPSGMGNPSGCLISDCLSHEKDGTLA